jgi:hypothetical protein
MLGGSSGGGSCSGVAAASPVVDHPPPSLDVTIVENSELASKLKTTKSAVVATNRECF